MIFYCKFAENIQINMNKIITTIVCGLLTLSCTAQNASEQNQESTSTGESSVVYMTKDISGMHTLDYGEEIVLGLQNYKIVLIND